MGLILPRSFIQHLALVRASFYRDGLHLDGFCQTLMDKDSGFNTSIVFLTHGGSYTNSQTLLRSRCSCRYPSSESLNL